MVGRHEYGLRTGAAFRRAAYASTIVPTSRFPRGTRVLAGGGAAAGRRLPEALLRGLPVARPGRARAHLPAAPARIPVTSAAAQGDASQPASVRRATECSSSSSAGASAREPARPVPLRPDRRLDPDLPLRPAVRALDGLRGLPRHAHARGVGRGLDNADAVADGLERTGRIVTAAAIIMVAAFSGFVDGRIAGLQEFGLGLAVAIFVDATIVRAVLVPSLMAVLGRWNWWLPITRRTTRATSRRHHSRVDPSGPASLICGVQEDAARGQGSPLPSYFDRKGRGHGLESFQSARPRSAQPASVEETPRDALLAVARHGARIQIAARHRGGQGDRRLGARCRSFRTGSRR